MSQRRIDLVLASSTGGIGRHVASLCAGLVAAGDRVRVLAPAATARQFDFAAEVVAVEIPAGPHLRDAAAIRTMRAAFRSDRPDVIHAHGLRAGLIAGYARPSAVPLVVTWHNAVLAHGLRAKAYRLLERRVATSAQVTLGASEDLVLRARELGARDARLGPVAAPPLPAPGRDPAEVREELGLAPGQPLILSVGRLHPQKHHEILIEAAATWRGRVPQPVVAIVGTGPAYMRLAGLISDRRAPVLLLGQRDDVSDLLAAADVAVVTSRWEARQLFAQEALRAGVPLVATAVGGIPELVGVAALLVPPGDAPAVAAAVGELLDDPVKRARYAQAGPVRAATWPTMQECLDQVSALYTELIAAAVGDANPADRAGGPVAANPGGTADGGAVGGEAGSDRDRAAR